MLVPIITLLMLIYFSSWEAAIFMMPVLMVWSSLYLFSPMGCATSLSPMMSIDSMSILLIMLTLWISTLMLISSMKYNYLAIKNNLFLSMVLTLAAILIAAFSVNNLFTYYIFFEASLIPTLTLILTWGIQPERLEAGMYLMMYTMSASLPLLMALLYNMSTLHTLNFMFTVYHTPNLFITLGLTLAFLVKLPMYFVHMWLPKAHVEAPVAGSMILASILLKLGAYGMLRLMTMYPNLMHTSTKTLLISISLWGAVLTSILCMKQTDMKEMIAYSSVSHMAIMMAAILTSYDWGWEGAFIMMIAHGLTSSGLFALVNMYYENTFSRNLNMNKGFLFISPTMAMWWFLMLAANMSAPPTINLLAEILIMQSMFIYCPLLIPVLLMPPIFTLAYSMILYTSLHHGPPAPLMNYPILPPTYYTIAFLHAAPSFLLITAASQLSL